MDLFEKSYLDYQHRRKLHWEKTADQMKHKKGLGGYYHHRLEQIFKNHISPGLSVLEIGCGNGDLLAAVKPSYGVGIDLSYNMLALARKKYPNLHFVLFDAQEVTFKNVSFDYIILSDVLNDSWDVQTIFENLIKFSHPKTRLIINTYSRLWELPLALAEKLNLARPVLNQNWLTVEDILNLLTLSGFEAISNSQEIIFPINLPIITDVFNLLLVKIWPFQHLGLTNFILARPNQLVNKLSERPSVSIIVPARNEAGNIQRIFACLPKMNCKIELIFVEGHSKDNTLESIRSCIAAYPEIDCKVFQQTGVGKGDAVRLGFEQASGDILMILDADLTVPAHYLPRFYEAIRMGKGDFINGVRLVYPMEKQAMQFFNLIGNKFFSLTFSWLLGQPLKDTLCGTKVLWREDYQRIAENRSYFGNFDPFGDFDLLFGAARLGLKIVDMPVRYRERTYGETNIQRWKHGWLLLQMAFFAARRIKFI